MGSAGDFVTTPERTQSTLCVPLLDGVAPSRRHVAFTVHGTPQPAGSKRGFHNPKTGRVIVTDANPQARPWKAQVADTAAQAMTFHSDEGTSGYLPPFDGPLAVELVFWVTRPKGHYGTGRNAGIVRASAPEFPTVRPDLLKLARAVEDAIAGIVYRDDAQIVAETLLKRYGDPARCDIVVSQEASQQVLS